MSFAWNRTATCLLLPLASVSAFACGSSTVLSSGGGGTGGTSGRTSTGPQSSTLPQGSSAGSTLSGSTTSTATIPAYCWTDAGALDPQAKACSADADCSMLATSTCCGASTIVGIAKAELSKYSACYPTPVHCPPRGCASQARTEDGNSAPSGVAGAQVYCDSAKACMTRTLPQDAGAVGAACTVDSQCAGGLKCCYPCGTPGCHNQCTTPMASGTCPLYP